MELSSAASRMDQMCVQLRDCLFVTVLLFLLVFFPVDPQCEKAELFPH